MKINRQARFKRPPIKKIYFKKSFYSFKAQSSSRLVGDTLWWRACGLGPLNTALNPYVPRPAKRSV